jgi:hypothetical protein
VEGNPAPTYPTICFVDIKKGREDCREFTEQRKMDRVVAESGLDPNDGSNVPEIYALTHSLKCLRALRGRLHYEQVASPSRRQWPLFAL